MSGKKRLCNFCNNPMNLDRVKPYCETCKEKCYRECLRCRLPFPKAKYYSGPEAKCCKKCEKAYIKEHYKWEEKKKKRLESTSSSSSSTSSSSDMEEEEPAGGIPSPAYKTKDLDLASRIQESTVKPVIQPKKVRKKRPATTTIVEQFTETMNKKKQHKRTPDQTKRFESLQGVFDFIASRPKNTVTLSTNI